MSHNLNTEHVDQALARLVEEFKNKPFIEGMLTAFVERYQLLENGSWEGYIARWFDNATGARLDDIGLIVKQPREGRDDNTYRKWLQARILLNRTQGRPDDTLDVLRLILPETTERSLVEEYPAAYVVRVFNDTFDPEQLLALLRLAKPAGVRLALEHSEHPSEDLFSFSDNLGTIQADADVGYSDATETTGGRYAGVIV